LIDLKLFMELEGIISPGQLEIKKGDELYKRN
jgi:hypothetical protein